MFGKEVSKPVVYICTGWLLLQEAAIEAFMIYLSALHILLARRGVTTLELILYRRQMDCEKDAMALE
jgi:hypothetical protein